MKTKLFVEILQHGSHNDSITKMIAGHNSGLREISLDDLKGYINCKAAEYPSLYAKSWATGFDGNNNHFDNKVFITEDSGKTFTVIVEAKSVPNTEIEDAYNQYCEGKKEIGEEPLTMEQWQELNNA